MPIGAHISIAGGVQNAPGRGKDLGCEAIQVFIRSNVRWSFPDLDAAHAAEFRAEVRCTGLHPVIAHSCYLVNLCSADAPTRRRSMKTLIDELRRCAALGIGDLVMHPGSHPAGPRAGIRTVAEGLTAAFAETSGLPVRVLLETTAGQGNQIGSTFEELRAVIRAVRPAGRVGVCVDTCHIFAAGYDIRTEPAYRSTFDLFDAVVGLRLIRAFHVNDSKRGLGSRIDRHQHIGRGCIGTEAFRLLLKDARFRHLPKIIETPKSDKERKNWDAVNISLLKKLRDS